MAEHWILSSGSKSPLTFANANTADKEAAPTSARSQRFKRPNINALCRPGRKQPIRNHPDSEQTSPAFYSSLTLSRSSSTENRYSHTRTHPHIHTARQAGRWRNSGPFCCLATAQLPSFICAAVLLPQQVLIAERSSRS